MTQYQLVLTVFYASLALYALLGTIGHARKWELGLVMFLCWISSNLIFWTVPQYRPALFPLLDVALMLTAARVGLLTGSRVPLILIGLSVLSIAMNAAVSLSGGIGAISVDQVNRYELGLNLIFIAQCLITGGWGHGFGWIGRVVRGPGHRGAAADLSSARSKKT